MASSMRGGSVAEVALRPPPAAFSAPPVAFILMALGLMVGAATGFATCSAWGLV